MEIIKSNTISKEETEAAIAHVKAKHPASKIIKIELIENGDFIDIKYWGEKIPFERIRRITGYLVNSLENWNDAKKAEEKDRVKHH